MFQTDHSDFCRMAKIVLTVSRRFCHLQFGDLNLFRVSDFEFRICSTYFCADPELSLAKGQPEGASGGESNFFPSSRRAENGAERHSLPEGQPEGASGGESKAEPAP